MGHRVTHGRSVPVALGALLTVGLLSGCGPEPRLLDDADFDGVLSSSHDEYGGVAPGWVRCRHLDPSGGLVTGPHAPSSWLWFDGGARAGATLLGTTSPHWSMEIYLEGIDRTVENCATRDATPFTGSLDIEPLTTIEGVDRAWRMQSEDGEWGEYAVVVLSPDQVLLGGFTTRADEPPVDLQDLLDHARDGAARIAP